MRYRHSLRAFQVVVALLLMAVASMETKAAEITDIGHIRDHGGTSALPPGDMYVEFGSECCGINRKAYDAIARAIRSDSGIRAATAEHWGKEGEVVLSIAVVPRARHRVLKRIKRLIPKYQHPSVVLRLTR